MQPDGSPAVCFYDVMSDREGRMMLIRRLTEDDAIVVAALRLEGLLGSPESFGMSYEEESQWDISKTIDRLRGQSPDDVWLGCFADQTLVGMGSFQRMRPLKARHKSEINAMYVTPEYRGKGVGRKVLDGLIAHARECSGVQQVRLSVGSSNNAAVSLYRAAGFVRYGLEPRSLKVDGRYIDVAHMILVF